MLVGLKYNKIICLCPKYKNILKKFLNENDIKEINIRWDYYFHSLLQLYKDGKYKENHNIETNLIYFLSILLMDKQSKKNIIEFYKSIKNMHSGYTKIFYKMPKLKEKFDLLL